MSSSHKPLTFAAMLVRAQRRFEALGRPFPSMRMQQAQALRPASQVPAGQGAARLALTPA